MSTCPPNGGICPECQDSACVRSASQMSRLVYWYFKMLELSYLRIMGHKFKSIIGQGILMQMEVGLNGDRKKAHAFLTVH